MLTNELYRKSGTYIVNACAHLPMTPLVCIHVWVAVSGGWHAPFGPGVWWSLLADVVDDGP